jgi:hypothetical protein
LRLLTDIKCDADRVSSAFDASTSVTTTFAPSFANSSAVARPIPEPAPVIKTTLFKTFKPLHRVWLTTCEDCPPSSRKTSYGGKGGGLESDAMSAVFTLKDLVGVWRRRSIEIEDGKKDTTTQVFWLQTHSCFGDIRIPIDRNPCSGRSSLNELTEFEAIALSKQKGFAGITQVEGATCQWHRYIDYQPSNGSRDIGLLEWEKDILIELGVDATYREEWERIDDGETGCIALILKPDESLKVSMWQGCFVLVGNYFVQILERRTALPKADSLTYLLESTQDKTQQRNHLNCEISFGCRNGDRIPWEIQLSTLPWQEGRSLWSMDDLQIDDNQEYLTQVVRDADGQHIHRWKICEWDNRFNVNVIPQR